MITEEILIDLIEKAYSQVYDDVRSKAEDQLILLRETHPTQFFMMLGDIIQDTILSIQTRQSTCLLVSETVQLKVNASPMLDSQEKFFWDRLNFESKEIFKQKILNLFASPTAESIEGVALIVGKIAGIELPRNEWKEIVNTLINNCYNENYPEISYEMLTSILISSSAYLTEYHDHFVKLTQAQLKMKNEISILNLKMWTQFAEDYAKKHIDCLKVQQQTKTNFLECVSSQLIESMIDCVLIQKELTQSQQQDLKMIAFKTIEAIVKVSNYSIIEKIVFTVSGTFTTADINARQNAILLFATIGRFRDQSFITQQLATYFPQILQILNDTNTTVVSQSLLGLSLLARSSPWAFLEQNKIEELIARLLDMCKNSTQLQNQAANILNYISSSLMKTYTNKDLTVLFSGCIAYYKQNSEQIYSSNFILSQKFIGIIMSFVIATNSIQAIEDIIHFSIEEVQFAFEEQPHNYQSYIEQIMSVLGTAILAGRSNSKSTVLNKILPKIIKCIDLCFLKQVQLTQILQVIGNTASVFKKEFQPYAATYWPYIKQSLKYADEQKLKIGLNCIGDLLRSQYPFYQKNLQIIAFLLKAFKENKNWKVKIIILQNAGDFSMTMTQQIRMYTEELIKIFDQTFSFVEDIIKNRKKLDMLEQINESVVEAYSGFTLGCSRIKPNKKLIEHFEKIVQFVTLTCDKGQNPSIQYMMNCLYLIFDMTASYSLQKLQYSETISKIVKSDKVTAMVQTMKKFDSRPDVYELISYIQTKLTSIW